VGDKDDQAAAPNFVHSMDGTHLVSVVNACNREGITDILPVHDCFYFLAPQAARGSEIILEQLWRMSSTANRWLTYTGITSAILISFPFRRAASPFGRKAPGS
jgi:DNA-dependent RNA polymerase